MESGKVGSQTATAWEDLTVEAKKVLTGVHPWEERPLVKSRRLVFADSAVVLIMCLKSGDLEGVEIAENPDCSSGGRGRRQQQAVKCVLVKFQLARVEEGNLRGELEGSAFCEKCWVREKVVWSGGRYASGPLCIPSICLLDVPPDDTKGTNSPPVKRCHQIPACLIARDMLRYKARPSKN